MTIKESISTMLDQLMTGDKTSAAASVGEILSSKVAAELENIKVDAADQMFNSSYSEESDIKDGTLTNESTNLEGNE